MSHINIKSDYKFKSDTYIQNRLRNSIGWYMSLYERHKYKSPPLADYYMTRADLKAKALAGISDFHDDCLTK